MNRRGGRTAVSCHGCLDQGKLVYMLDAIAVCHKEAPSYDKKSLVNRYCEYCVTCWEWILCTSGKRCLFRLAEVTTPNPRRQAARSCAPAWCGGAPGRRQRRMLKTPTASRSELLWSLRPRGCSGCLAFFLKDGCEFCIISSVFRSW